MNVMNSIVDDLGDKCIIEQKPKMEGYNIVMLLNPA
jgi:translation initiation factor IF-3